MADHRQEDLAVGSHRLPDPSDFCFELFLARLDPWGRIYFHVGDGKTRQIILSVKAGKLHATHIRDLRGCRSWSYLSVTRPSRWRPCWAGVVTAVQARPRVTT